MSDSKYTPPSGKWNENKQTTQRSVRFPHRLAVKIFVMASKQKISFAQAVIKLCELGIEVEEKKNSGTEEKQ